MIDSLIVNKRLFIANLFIVMNVVAGKVFFNEGSSVSNTVTSSIAAYMIAVVFFSTFGYVFIITNKKSLPRNDMLIIALVYYLWMFIWSFFSNIPLMSFYYSVSGILMLVFSKFYAESFAYLDMETRYKNVKNTMFIVFLSYALSAVFFELYYLHKPLASGLPLGFAALFYYFFVFLVTKKMLDKNKISLLLLVLPLVLLGIYFKSFSALLSYVVCMGVYLILKRRYILALTMLTILILTTVSFMSFLYLNEGSDADIAGKSVNSILSGSGRFVVYEKALQTYSDMGVINKIKGVGFMTERTVLSHYELAWSTDVHNSFLLSLVTGGIGGLIIYLSFVFYPLLSKYRKMKYFDDYIIYHLMCVIFGLSSSYYIGRPSYLMLLSIIFFFVFIKPEKVGSVQS